MLNHLINKKGTPHKIRMANGPEFTVKITSQWSEMHNIESIIYNLENQHKMHL